jgi:integrase/recombinase XerD
MTIINAGELMLSDVTAYISTLVPIHVNKVKSELSAILTNYHVTRVEEDEVHPDLQEKIEWYLAAKRLDGLSHLTIDGYRLELNIFAREVKKKVENITAADIRIYLNKFPHLKNSSLGGKLIKVRSFFTWLFEEEIITRNPATKLKPPKEDKHLPKTLNIEELEILRESCRTLRQRALIELMYATGCRLSEIQQLNKSDINYQMMGFVVFGKGSTEREVYFSFRTKLHLEKYLNSRDDDCEALFVTERKPYRRMQNRSIQDEVRKVADAAGLSGKVSPHTMRRTFATLTLNNGADIVAVQDLLGHSSPETTMRYARITEERKREQHKKYLVI